MDKAKALNPIEEKLPFGKNLMLALQHVFVMVAGAVVVPILIAGTAGRPEDTTFLISCTLISAGIATLLQCIGLGKFSGTKVAIVEGTSFAALAATQGVITSGVGGAEGLRAVAGAVIVAGLFCVLISGLWSKLLKLFPDVVTGTVVTVIGLSLFPIAINWIADNADKVGDAARVVPIQDIMLALVTLLVVLLCSKFLKGLLGNLSVLIGIIAGTVVAIIHDMVAVGAMPMLNANSVQQLANAKVFALVTPFKYGLPTFEMSAIVPMMIAMLVIMTQATGSMMAVFNISGKEMDEKELKKGLRSNGISTAIAGAFNSYPVTVFAQNIGMLSLTGVISRFVTATAGGILVILAFFPKFAAAFAAIPKPVLGGAGFAMFGVVLVNGIRTLGKVNYEGNKNAIIVAVSIGLSMITIVNPSFFRAVHPMLIGVFREIPLGSIAAVVLNIFFNILFVPKDKLSAVSKK